MLPTRISCISGQMAEEGGCKACRTSGNCSSRRRRSRAASSQGSQQHRRGLTGGRKLQVQIELQEVWANQSPRSDQPESKVRSGRGGGAGEACSSEPVWLWLWLWPAAAATIGPLALEPPYAMGEALKRQKKKKCSQDRRGTYPLGPGGPGPGSGRRARLIPGIS